VSACDTQLVITAELGSHDWGAGVKKQFGRHAVID